METNIENQSLENSQNEILDAFSNIFKPDFSGLMDTNIVQEPEFDQKEYFSSNTVKRLSELSDEDLITISLKNKETDGYTAKFVKLKDIIRFIKLKIDEKN